MAETQTQKCAKFATRTSEQDRTRIKRRVYLLLERRKAASGMVRKKNVEEVSGSFVWVEGLNSQAAKLGKSYEARQVVALNLAERGSAIYCIAADREFLKTDLPPAKSLTMM